MTHTARGEFVVSLKPLAFEDADPEFKINMEQGKHFYEFTYRFPAE